jgi:hypothetical protein
VHSPARIACTQFASACWLAGLQLGKLAYGLFVVFEQLRCPTGRLQVRAETMARQVSDHDSGIGSYQPPKERPSLTDSSRRGLWIVRPLSDNISIEAGHGTTVTVLVHHPSRRRGPAA